MDNITNISANISSAINGSNLTTNASVPSAPSHVWSNLPVALPMNPQAAQVLMWLSNPIYVTDLVAIDYGSFIYFFIGILIGKICSKGFGTMMQRHHYYIAMVVIAVLLKFVQMVFLGNYFAADSFIHMTWDVVFMMLGAVCADVGFFFILLAILLIFGAGWWMGWF